MREWHIYIDGASLGNPGHSGAGMIALDHEGKEVFRDGVYLGEMTNNMAEYEALIKALRKAESADITSVHIYTDSLLVANQVLGTYRIKNEKLKPYLDETRRLATRLARFEVKYIPREQNRIADKLAKHAAAKRGRCVVAGKPEESPGIEGQDGP